MTQAIHSLIIETQNNDAGWKKMCNTTWNTSRSTLNKQSFPLQHHGRRTGFILPRLWLVPLCTAPHTTALLAIERSHPSPAVKMPQKANSKPLGTEVLQHESRCDKHPTDHLTRRQDNARPAHGHTSDMFPTIANSTCKQPALENPPTQSCQSQVAQQQEPWNSSRRHEASRTSSQPQSRPLSSRSQWLRFRNVRHTA